MARRLDVPGWVRAQPRTWLSSSETKNIRSGSPRWAIERIEILGLPSGAWSIASTSSGSPWTHASNPGEASRLFIRMARAKRSLAGKNDSRSITPTCWKGGCWIRGMSAAMSRSSPAFQASARILEIRMCSGLCIGSASMPSRPRRLPAVVATRSLSASPSSRIASGGAANDLRIETGSPAWLPGV